MQGNEAGAISHSSLLKLLNQDAGVDHYADEYTTRRLSQGFDSSCPGQPQPNIQAFL